MHGTYTVLKGENTAKDAEREVSQHLSTLSLFLAQSQIFHNVGPIVILFSSNDTILQYKIYLFEAILLCCKEVHPNKQKNKLISKPVVDRSGKPRIQLKGRIFMQNVTETISLGKPGQFY